MIGVDGSGMVEKLMEVMMMVGVDYGDDDSGDGYMKALNGVSSEKGK